MWVCLTSSTSWLRSRRGSGQISWGIKGKYTTAMLKQQNATVKYFISISSKSTYPPTIIYRNHKITCQFRELICKNKPQVPVRKCQDSLFCHNHLDTIVSLRPASASVWGAAKYPDDKASVWILNFFNVPHSLHNLRNHTRRLLTQLTLPPKRVGPHLTFDLRWLNTGK